MAGDASAARKVPGPDVPAVEWLTSSEAAARLGVKRATLYAYVSRGILGRTQRASGRASYFSATEIARVATERSRRRGQGRTTRP